MAVISFLLSFVVKKVGTIVQAVFGWSITALFGRLPGRRQMMVTVALIVSLAWPVFVAGLVFPPIAGWILAFAPIERWVGAGILRLIWGTLAVAAPLLVGALVHVAAPSRKGGLLRSVLHGYPLALGFFCAFLITALTVPLVQLASILRGWSDEHIYVQPRNGEYKTVLRDVAEACARSGLVPVIEDPPRRMTLAANVLHFFARGALTAMVTETLQRVRAGEIEIYLYPSDLLVRGKLARVARFRAMLGRTRIEKNAYLVEEPAAQDVQDELARVDEVLTDHDERHVIAGGILGRRLITIANEMSSIDVSYASWVILERIARNLERRLAQQTVGHDAFPLDDARDGLDEVAKRANRTVRETSSTVPVPH